MLSPCSRLRCLLVLLLDLLHIRNRSRPIKQLCDLFQASSLRLGEEDIRDGQEYGQETAKYDVILPPDILHADWVHKGRNDQRHVDAQQLAGDALAPQTVRPQLRRVRHQERRVRDVVVEIEGKQAHDNDDAGCAVARVVVDGAARRPDDVRRQHAHAGPDEQRAPADAVHQDGGGERGAEVEDLEQPVDQGLVERVGDADGVEDEGQVVRHHADAVPLREGAQADGYEETFAVSGRGDEGGPGGRLGGLLEADGRGDLGDFADDERAGVVAARVVAGEDCLGFGGAFLGDEPSVAALFVSF